MYKNIKTRITISIFSNDCFLIIGIGKRGWRKVIMFMFLRSFEAWYFYQIETTSNRVLLFYKSLQSRAFYIPSQFTHLKHLHQPFVDIDSFFVLSNYIFMFLINSGLHVVTTTNRVFPWVITHTNTHTQTHTEHT